MQEEHAKALFLLAGIEVQQLHKLLNEYWQSNEPVGPWWLAQTPYGCIRLGWRKRVIEIAWSGTELRTLITADDVTKDQTVVHAWSYVKALEYLSALGAALKALKRLSVG